MPAYIGPGPVIGPSTAGTGGAAASALTTRMPSPVASVTNATKIAPSLGHRLVLDTNGDIATPPRAQWARARCPPLVSDSRSAYQGTCQPARPARRGSLHPPKRAPPPHALRRPNASGLATRRGSRPAAEVAS